MRLSACCVGALRLWVDVANWIPSESSTRKQVAISRINPATSASKL